MRIVKKTLLSILLCLGVMTGAVSAQGWTVTPGEGVGAVTVDSTLGSLEAILKPTRKIGPETKPAFVEFGKALIIEFEANKVATISLHENSFATKNGNVSWVPYRGGAIGSAWNTVAGQITSRKLSRKLPTAKGHPEEYYHAFPDIGLGFQVKGGAISRVDIWRVR